jgi:5'-3' exonuclease
MGIEKFFLNLKLNKYFSKNITEKLSDKFDFVYLDLNSIICRSIEIIENDLNYVQFEIIYNKINDITTFSDKAVTIINKNGFVIIDNKIELNIDKYFLNSVNEHLNLIFNEVDKSYIKMVYVAQDGVATMAKIVEQRRRKYTKYILDEIKKRIYNKYESTIDTVRKEFEQNKIYVDLTFKINIDSLIKNILPNVNVIISDKLEYGEGEKKIFEHISINNNYGSYLIVSPDSDVIVLSLLHQNLMTLKSIETSFHIIKNINPIEYINVDMVKANLVEYTLNRITKFKIEDRNFNPNEISIISDLIILIQFLGNDFIPKLYSFASRSSLHILIDIYVRHITRTKNKFKYIVFYENDLFKLNYENLNSIIFKLSENEYKLIYETYCVNNYKNFNYLLSIFDNNTESPFFYDKLTSYIYGFNKIMTTILTHKNTNKDGKFIYENILNKYLDRDVFIKIFLLIESETNYPLETKSENDLITDTIDILDRIIENIRSGKNYRGRLRFVKYSTTINDQYHLQQITNNLSHPKMIMSEYDKNYYKFEKKLDEYYYILSSDNDLKFGYIDIHFKNNYYKLLLDNSINENKKIFYEEKIKTFQPNKIREICSSYLYGLFWNFDFYFNKNDHQKNTQYISIWYYDQDVVPFLKDLQLFMKDICGKNNLGNKIFYQITNQNSAYYVTKNNYLTDLEQYMYITPNQKLENKIPTKYNKLLQNKNIFPDIRKIIEDILDGNITTHLDLSNCLYINKCKILGLNIITYNNLIKLFREQ